MHIDSRTYIAKPSLVCPHLSSAHAETIPDVRVNGDGVGRELHVLRVSCHGQQEKEARENRPAKRSDTCISDSPAGGNLDAHRSAQHNISLKITNKTIMTATYYARH